MTYLASTYITEKQFKYCPVDASLKTKMLQIMNPLRPLRKIVQNLNTIE